MAGNSSYSMQRRLGSAKQHEYSVVSNFPNGYRNREDVTNLPPSVLIVGSQNVLTNVSDRVQIRQGYALDGAVSAVAGPVLSSFDWLTKGMGEVHMRAGGLTSAGNDGKLQYRYVDSAGAVTWRDLTTSLTTVAYNFAKYWNNTEAMREVLFVNGTPDIFRWNGATTTLLSATANTITKSGSDSWSAAGFYGTANKTLVINGSTYTYTGGINTTTLTGTSNASAEPVGSVIHQAVVTASNVISGSFTINLIETLNNQVFLGSFANSVVYISKVNNYIDYSFSTPRQTGEGWNFPLDDNPVAFKPQESFMYISAGQDLWYNVNFELQTSTVGVTYEQVNAEPLKTGRRQAAFSQAAVSHMKNNIIVITKETTIDTLGRVLNIQGTPQTTNMSDPIKIDIDSYDFTNCSISYWRYYILVAVPAEGIVLMYSLATSSWEAPQTLPVSRFYIVNGDIYGHSYSTFESYQLFTGYADRVYPTFSGFPIAAVWKFSFQNYGSRFALKKATKMYVEGYINSNTVLTASITYELDGCATTKTFSLDGSDTQFVCIAQGEASLGKTSLGKQKLGGDTAQSINNLPPKFRWFPTFTNTDFFESSISFSVLGTDNRMELLAFGLAASGSSEIPVQHMD